MIQWFPGHMNKAKIAIKDLVTEIDIVIELLDARAPFSSCNPLIQSMIKHKKKIRLLNKSDLADPQITKLWVEFFTQKENSLALTGNKNNQAQKKQIIELCKTLAPNRNSFDKPLRVMITGIPNVGKSTLINQLIGKKSAKVGDIPAVTRANQCLTVSDSFLIYDTPGMTWQKIRHLQIGFNLAICNSIGRNAIDEETLALYLVEYLKSDYKNLLNSRYKLTALDCQKDSSDLLNIIGRKRGCILPGNKIDRQKVSELIIQDFRDGRIGLISLETPILWQKWISEAQDESDDIEDCDSTN